MSTPILSCGKIISYNKEIARKAILSAPHTQMTSELCLLVMNGFIYLIIVHGCRLLVRYSTQGTALL